jgi:hypothetical protein
MIYFTLPPGYHLHPGRCAPCGRDRIEVDRVEGLPIHACPAGCGRGGDMLIRVRRVWSDEATGEVIPEADDRLYDTRCEYCGVHPAGGVHRRSGMFLCPDCYQEGRDRDDFPWEDD